MHVIWHDYITTDPDVEFLDAFQRIFSKRLVRGIQTINFASMESTYRDEKKRRIIGLKNLLQPWRSLLDHRASVEAVMPARKIVLIAGVSHTNRKMRPTQPPLQLQCSRTVGILAGGFISASCSKPTAADIGSCKSQCCGHRASAVAERNRPRRRNCRAESWRRYDLPPVAKHFRAHPVRHRKLRTDTRDGVAQS